MDKKYAKISGAILAGGQSSRMGFPKYLLPVNGRTIIENTIEFLGPYFEELFLVADSGERFSWLGDVPVVEDLVRDCGPLGGIYSGLKAMSNPQGFFVACDMPFLAAGLLDRILTVAQQEDAPCVVPLGENGAEPLHAVYSKQLLPHIEQALDQKEFSLKELLRESGCRYVKVEGGEARALANVNTPEDLKRILESEGMRAGWDLASAAKP